ncbi:MAG: hypothetical protein ABFS42_05330 [Candidatus Krumholzibacteriota bacterium]
MNRNLLLPITIACGLAVFAACGSDVSPPPNEESSPYFIEHINKGCAGDTRSTVETIGDAYLQGYSFAEDTLTLDIHFEANCCPEFVEITEVLMDRISIEVGDTLYGCRCICPYDNQFRFVWDHAGEVEIDFKSTGGSGPAVISAFDTLLVVSP